MATVNQSTERSLAIMQVN